MKQKWVFVGLGLLVSSLSVKAEAGTISEVHFYSEIKPHVFENQNNITTITHKNIPYFSKRLNLVINDEVSPQSTISNPDSHRVQYSVGVKASIDIKDTFSNAQAKTDDERCDRINFDVSWTESENRLVPDQYDHHLCFGYKLRIPSPWKLLLPGSEQEVSLFVRGVEGPIGVGILTTKKAPVQSSSPVVDDSHDRD